MSKHIVITGDKVIFQPNFGIAIAGPIPSITIEGSGHATILGENICIDGDESNVKLTGVKYSAGAYQILGTCTLTIESLASDQTANHTYNGKKVITVGSKFTAKLAVNMPAINPNNPNDKDLTTSYFGNGTFKNTQSFVTAE